VRLVRGEIVQQSSFVSIVRLFFSHVVNNIFVPRHETAQIWEIVSAQEKNRVFNVLLGVVHKSAGGDRRLL